MFTLTPGLLPTRIAAEAIPVYVDGGGSGAPDAVALPAATMLYLTSGRADWLSGRFVHFTDDIDASESPFFLCNGIGRYCSANWYTAEVERYWNDVIVQKGGLLNKLYIPRS